MNTGIKVKLKRISLGLPQYVVSNHLCITQTELCAIENNRKQANEETFQKINDAIEELAGEQT